MALASAVKLIAQPSSNPNPQVARELIKFMTSPEAAALLGKSAM
jgi:hypothetical protein